MDFPKVEVTATPNQMHPVSQGMKLKQLVAKFGREATVWADVIELDTDAPNEPLLRARIKVLVKNDGREEAKRKLDKETAPRHSIEDGNPLSGSW